MRGPARRQNAFELMKKTLLMILLAGLSLQAAGQVAADELRVQRQVEREAYAKARSLNTVDAWEIFLNNYPESLLVEQARKQRDDARVRSYCNAHTTLERLTTYIDENTAHEPRIRLFYANLVNNPTHSYRFEHMNVGFNGCTGRVDETLTFADGTKPRLCHFIFNDQGLLTKSSIKGSRAKPVVTRYSYDYDNLHGYRLASIEVEGRKAEPVVARYDDRDKLEALTGTIHRWNYSYNEAGGISKVVSAIGDTRRTLVYNDGYVIREERDGQVWRYLYDYDSATFKKYLIGVSQIESEKPEPELKYDYEIDSRGRVTRVEVTRGGQPLMTITRTYSN